MERIVAENRGTRFVLNHSHAYPFHLPATSENGFKARFLFCKYVSNSFESIYKVKIIFISRDPRATATSGYHFFGGMEKYKPMFDSYSIKSIDDFARIVFEGKHSYGSITRYDKAWKDFAKMESKAQIHFLTFEDLKQNTSRNISEIDKR